MVQAVPDCLVGGYQPLVEGLELPDPDDRHVLAAAIRARAQVIVTANLRDFPEGSLEPYGVEAQAPDEFVLDLLSLSPEAVETALRQQAGDLRSPAQTVGQLLDTLERSLPTTVREFRQSMRKE